MKISLVADRHGMEFDIYRGMDLYLLLGDNGVSDSMARLDNLAGDGVPVVSVLGNHDTVKLCETYPNITWIPQSGFVSVNGINICGVSGCVRYNSSSECMWTQKEYSLMLRSLYKNNSKKADLLISHTPSYAFSRAFGIKEKNSPHSGILYLDKLIRRLSPRLCCFGHLHQNKLYNIRKKKMICVYGTTVIDF